jgi:hypothetical protein
MPDNEDSRNVQIKRVTNNSNNNDDFATRASYQGTPSGVPLGKRYRIGFSRCGSKSQRLKAALISYAKLARLARPDTKRNPPSANDLSDMIRNRAYAPCKALA